MSLSLHDNPKETSIVAYVRQVGGGMMIFPVIDMAVSVMDEQFQCTNFITKLSNADGTIQYEKDAANIDKLYAEIERFKAIDQQAKDLKYNKFPGGDKIQYPVHTIITVNKPKPDADQ